MAAVVCAWLCDRLHDRLHAGGKIMRRPRLRVLGVLALWLLILALGMVQQLMPRGHPPCSVENEGSCFENPAARDKAWYRAVVQGGNLSTALLLGTDQGSGGAAESVAASFRRLFILDLEERAVNSQRVVQWRAWWKSQSHAEVVVRGGDYVTTLQELLRMPAVERPVFDYALVDGLHEWQADGLAFFLVDQMLRPGGVIEFASYWKTTISASPTTRQKDFTEAQLKEPLVKAVVDLLVAEDPNYEDLTLTAVSNRRVFRKKITALSVPRPTVERPNPKYPPKLWRVADDCKVPRLRPLPTIRSTARH